MSMRRDQATSDSPLPLFLQSPVETARLQAVFRTALRLAFASSLAAAAGGCSSDDDDGPVVAADGGVHPPTAGSASAGKAGASAGKGGAGSRAVGAGGATGVAGKAAVAGSPAADGGGGGVGGANDADAGPAAGGASGAPGAAQKPTCDSNGSWQPLGDLKPAEPFDFASLRTLYRNQTMFQEAAKTGLACANAADANACQSMLDATATGLDLTDSCGMVGACRHYLVTTHGDTVKRYASRAELLAFLGPIDAPQDALLLLDHDGYQIDCNASAVTVTPEGYELDVRQMVSDCPVQHALVHVLVTPSGEIVERKRELLPQEQVCIGRRPAGLVAQLGAAGGDALGMHFAAMAELEAASVPRSRSWRRSSTVTVHRRS